MSVKERVDKLVEDIGLIVQSVNLNDKKEKVRVLASKAQNNDLWDNPENARKIMQEFADLKKEVENIESLRDQIILLKQLSEIEEDKKLEKEIYDFEKKLSLLKIESFFDSPYDKKDAILSIHSGQGGAEAMDWASMLYRMYLRFCEKNDWQVITIDIIEGEEAGIKTVSMKISHKFAYGFLRGETGTHRLVRQSPFNADRLRQTSFALVEVLPELDEIDLPSVKIKDDDLEWQFFRASSQGGQNVQKVSTAVRLIHKPSGIIVTAQTERYQEQNRKYALSHLRAKLWAREQAKLEMEEKKLKGEYRPPSWGNQIRSYVLHPYKMVKDLRSQVETSDAEGVLDGDLWHFLEGNLMPKSKI